MTLAQTTSAPVSSRRPLSTPAAILATPHTSAASSLPDDALLKQAIKEMYQKVSEEPQAEFHFELGRALTERLGYPTPLLDAIPQQAIESFAGVGYHFDMPKLKRGESVLDLGSGSGTDAFCAARLVGPEGRVVGVDMTVGQLEKARRLAAFDTDLSRVAFTRGYIEQLPAADGEFDCVVSNGVINLVTEKEAVFQEAARVLRPGGRLAISDIVTQTHLPPGVTCNAELWASCIGGAMHRADYCDAIEAAGFEIQYVRSNDYQFLPGRAQRSANKYGVVSMSVLAIKR